MSKTLARNSHNNVMLLLHKTAPPDDPEWAEYVEAMKRLEAGANGDISRISVLVFTDGAAPSAPQRALINNWINGRQLSVSVVSSSALVRSVGTAMAWFNKGLKVFDPHKWEAAMQHARIEPRDFGICRAMLEKMDESLGGSATVRAAFFDKAARSGAGA